MIVSGFGFRSNATVDSFRSAFENTISKHKFSKPLVVAVPQDKVNHNSLIFLLEKLVARFGNKSK